jgi:hypothetical protein
MDYAASANCLKTGGHTIISFTKAEKGYMNEP